MTLLYPYRHSHDNGRELKHSIRSMVKHMKGITGVCVIGDKPDWYVGEHVPAHDVPGRKEYNIVSKVIQSPHETFVLASDDCFAQQDFYNYPFYSSGLLSETIRPGRYHHRLANTKLIYPAGHMFDIHYPMLIERDKFREAHDIDWTGKEYLCKSVYANYINAIPTMASDCKVRNGGSIPPGPFFSTSDRTSKFIPLETMYPIPSQYES